MSEALITQWAVVLVPLELINSFHSLVIVVPECFSFEESLTSFCNVKCRLILFFFFFVEDRQICLCSQNFAGSVHLLLFYLLISVCFCSANIFLEIFRHVE